MPDVSTAGAAAGAEDDGDSGPDDAGPGDAGRGDDAGADGDAETGDDGAALTDGLGTGDALAVAELFEVCCADTTAEPQPAAASAAVSTSAENADDRPRIAGLRSNTCTSSPDTRMRDQQG
jgi:hypothetical protein